MRSLVAFAAGLALFATRPACAAEESAPLGRLDFSPYHVAVLVSFAPSPLLTSASRKTIVSLLATRIGQTFGAGWTLEPQGSVLENDSLTPVNEAGLERLTYAAAAPYVAGKRSEKAYFLVVRPDGSDWLLCGREWDRTLESMSPLATATTRDPRALPDAALGLLMRLFSPVLNVDDADRESKFATLTVRAGSIPFGDSQFASLKPGAILLPVFRFLDAQGKVRKIQPVPWTYLVLDKIADGHAHASIKSTYRAPLAANMRRRVEAVAVLLRPTLPTTRLKLVAGKNPPQPLGGIFVWLASPVTDKKTPAGPIAKLLSDRDGVISVPVDHSNPLRMIEVHSGSAILARRPFVPGIDAEATLELADDRLRLSTEREVDLLRGQLIETVARRAAFIGQTRAAVKRNDLVTAQQRLGELQHLPGAQQFADELNKIRQLAIEEAGKDVVSKRRIDDMCKNTAQLIEQYLPEDRIQAFKEEITTAVAEVKAPKPRPAKPKGERGLPLDLKPTEEKPKAKPGTMRPEPEKKKTDE